MRFNRQILLLLTTVIFGCLIQTSCSSLKYIPVKTPAELEQERQAKIEEQLSADFKKQNLRYKSLGFASPTVVKPPSYYLLDSMYGVKYTLEKNNQFDSQLEEQIKIQKLIVANDTTPVLFQERNAFSIEDSTSYEVLLAELYVSQDQKIESFEIIESSKIDRKLSQMYAAYLLKESFIYPHAEAGEAEIEFYNLYGSMLNSLQGKAKQEFLEFMLTVMKVAYRYNNLDKDFLIKEFVRHFVQGETRNMLDEKFHKMEEFFGENNDLLYYYVDYQYHEKNSLENSEVTRVEVFLDPYLRLIEIRKK